MEKYNNVCGSCYDDKLWESKRYKIYVKYDLYTLYINLVVTSKKKNGIEVSKAFEEIIKDAIKVGHKFYYLLQTSKRLESKKEWFNSLMKKFNTENEEKSSIIERYNRTHNNRMKVIFESIYIF